MTSEGRSSGCGLTEFEGCAGFHASSWMGGKSGERGGEEEVEEVLGSRLMRAPNDPSNVLRDRE